MVVISTLNLPDVQELNFDDIIRIEHFGEPCRVTLGQLIDFFEQELETKEKN